MKVLIIGGTGLISRGIVFADRRFDVVIDMICFRPEDAESDVRAFGGRCEQLQFCSSVAAYGVGISDQVLVDESFAPQPISPYGKGKLGCEQVLLRAHAEGRFKTTIFRPANTYGPGRAMADQLEIESVAWDRVDRGLPVVCADGAMTLWQSTHVDDCGKAFAYGALNPKTYGETYSAYSSAKAKRDIPEFRCTIDFPDGARATVEDLRRTGALRDSRGDELYAQMAGEAAKAGDRIDLS